MAKNDNVTPIERFNPSYDFGLTTEQVEQRKSEKLTNKIVKKTGKSYFRIIVDNFCTLLTLSMLLFSF